MTHAERIREAERAVVEAATVAKRLTWEAKKLLALRAATCPTCGGTGDGERSRYAGCPGIVTPPCPSGCDAGRRRDA